MSGARSAIRTAKMNVWVNPLIIQAALGTDF